MAKPGIQNINTTNTFQNWLDATNEVIDIIRDEALTASVIGDTTTGNATLIGSFTADTLVADDVFRTDVIESKSVTGNFFINSPFVANTSIKTPATFKSTLGPTIGFTDDTVTWNIGFKTTLDPSFIISTGIGNPAFELESDGTLNVSSLISDYVGGESGLIVNSSNSAANVPFSVVVGSFTGISNAFTSGVYSSQTSTTNGIASAIIASITSETNDELSLIGASSGANTGSLLSTVIASLDSSTTAFTSGVYSSQRSNTNGNASAIVASVNSETNSELSLIGASNGANTSGSSSAVIASLDSSSDGFTSGVYSSQGSSTKGNASSVMASINSETNNELSLIGASQSSNTSGSSSAIIASLNSSTNGFTSGVYSSQRSNTNGTASAIVASLLSETNEELSFIAGSLNAITSGKRSSIIASDSCEISGNTVNSSVISSSNSVVESDNGSIISSLNTNITGPFNSVISSSTLLEEGSINPNIMNGSINSAIASASFEFNENTQNTVSLASKGVIMGSDLITGPISHSAVIASTSSNMGGTGTLPSGFTPTTLPMEGGVVISSRNVIGKSWYSLAMGFANSGGASSVNRTIEFRSLNGTGRATGGFSTGSPADFAEMFENKEGVKIPAGSIVTLDGDGVRIAQEGDDIDGVVSYSPALLANDSPFFWQGRHEKDDFGNLIYEEQPLESWDGDPKERPMINVPKEAKGWDPEKPQTPRSERPDEWTPVGLVGQVYVKVSKTVKSGDKIKPSNDGVGVPSTSRTGLKCMKITTPFDKEKGYAVAKCIINVQV